MENINLEGKLVKVLYYANRHDARENKKTIVTGIVTGYDYDIGITIQNNLNKDQYLFCIHGELSPIRRGVEYKEYDLFFNLITERIISGEVDFTDLGHSDERPSAETCPFS